jgi:hypothetical protein
MKGRERDELFRRARQAATPGEDDQRRVRAALRHRLGVAAGVSVGVAGAKAAASLGPTGLLAGAGVSGLALVKVATVLIAVATVGLAVMPARRAASGPHGYASSAPIMKPVTLPPASPLSSLPTLEVSPPPTPTLGSPSTAPGSPSRLHELPGTPPVATAEGHTPSVSRKSPEPVSDGSSVDIGAEVELMAGMQAGLREGDTSRVLELVREHERRFPMSAWAPEREGARVLALCTRVRAEDPSDAHSLGETFLDTNPLSPLGARVRSTCGLPAETR